jgi:hypothetical protein
MTEGVWKPPSRVKSACRRRLAVSARLDYDPHALEILKRLARAFGVPVTELLECEGTSTPRRQRAKSARARRAAATSATAARSQRQPITSAR